MKMDVEGFEANVIKGGAGTIAAHQPVIVLEQHESEFAGDSTESLTLLRGLGYVFCWHRAGAGSQAPLVRRLSNLAELVSGRKYQILSGETVPRGSYAMLIAVPPRFRRELRLSR